jgi:hypothetical protein
MTTKTEPPTLPGCEVLPPMGSPDGAKYRQQRKPGKAKGKPNRRRAGSRFRVLNAFIDFTMGGLRRSDIAVWLVLYRDTKSDGIARTGQADMARRAGISRRTVVRVIGRLEGQGLLVRIHRGGLNRGVSSYRILPLEGERPCVP